MLLSPAPPLGLCADLREGADQTLSPTLPFPFPFLPSTASPLILSSPCPQFLCPSSSPLCHARTRHSAPSNNQSPCLPHQPGRKAAGGEGGPGLSGHVGPESRVTPRKRVSHVTPGRPSLRSPRECGCLSPATEGPGRSSPQKGSPHWTHALGQGRCQSSLWQGRPLTLPLAAWGL